MNQRAPLCLAAAVALSLAFALTVVRLGEAREGAAPEDSSTKSARDVAAALDQVITLRLELDGVAPAARSDDTEFLRRLYLDLVGTVPTPQEVEAFGAAGGSDKRARKIEELLASEAYAENWATWWYHTLTGLSPHQRRAREGQGGRFLAGEAGKTFHGWLSTQMSSNRPYDELVQELVTATGRTDENGAAGFMARWESNANNAAGAVAKSFLGVQIQCAQCHDHIYETEWKQVDFKGMAAFFATTSARRVPEYREVRRLRALMQGAGKGTDRMDADASGEMDGGRSGGAGDKPKERTYDGMTRQELAAKMRELRKYNNIVDVQDAKVNPRQAERMRRNLAKAKKAQPERMERMALMATTPKFWLDAEAADLPGIPRRYLLARWITADDNPYFARALANKLWAALMGRGIVSPTEDFNSFNEASHPKILEILAEDFRTNGYDLKRVLRILANTETYQRSSRWTGEESPDPAQFAKAPVRPLSMEQFYFSLVRATGMEERLDQVSRRQGQQIQQAIFSTFSFVFDDDEGKEEQDFSGSIPQGLFLMNGELFQRAISAGREAPQRKGKRRRDRRGRDRRARSMGPAQTAFGRLLREETSAAERVQQIYLRAYGRKPEAAEQRLAIESVKQAGDDRQAWEDFFWAILNSAEFMTNH